MRKIYILLIYCLLVIISNKSEVKKCGEAEIENCIECGQGENANTCVKCKDNYFLTNNNIFCIACNDPLYGQVGCSGSCDGRKHNETRNVICTSPCKEGYYYLNGFCIPCSEGAYACKKCSPTDNNNGEEEFKCLECINNEYKLNNNNYNQCVHCSKDYCIKCHYDDNGNPICDECEYGYYKKDGGCVKCKGDIPITGGFCTICSDDDTDYEAGPCWCNPYFTQKSHSICINCPEHCHYCQYNNITNISECIYCDSGYVLNSKKECTSCGEGCEYCLLSDDNTPVCTLCFSQTFLSDNGNCLICPENCRTCKLDANNQIECTECLSEYGLSKDKKTCKACPWGCSLCNANENDDIICSQCYYYHYALNSQNQCIYCSDLTDDGLEGCERCGYNNGKYECYECARREKTDSYYMEQIYTYVSNTYQCFSNTDPEQPSFYGCLEAYYNEETGNYECLTCKTDYDSYFIPVINEKICINRADNDLLNCYEAENIGDKNNPKYSCHKCYSDVTKIKTFENVIKCYDREFNDKIAYCEEGEKDSSGNLKCNKCVSNSQLNNVNICECNSDSFGKYKKWCYKCDDQNNGIPGCNAEKGCSDYYYSNDRLNCNECKEGYFNYTEGQCYLCSNEIKDCQKCHFDENKEKLICDKCPYGYSYNEKDKKCELTNCEDYPEFSEGCLVCDGNREEFLRKKECHKCKPGYFKTKDNNCVRCRSEEYGGEACFKCDYETDEDGNEIDKISCKYCPNKWHVLSSDGKCYNCEKYVSNCDICEFKKLNDESEKIVCNICKPGYQLDSEGKCINYLNYLKTVPNCSEYTYKLNNITFCANYYYYYYDYDDYEEKKYYYSNAYYCYVYKNKYYYGYSSSWYSNIYDFINSYNYKENYNNNNFTIPKINDKIDTQCLYCESGYYMDEDGNCISISIEECSLISIIENFPERYEMCRSLCGDSDYIYIDLNIRDKTNNTYTKLNMRDFFYDYRYKDHYLKSINDILNDKELLPLFIENKLCISRGDNKEKYSGCQSVEYEKSSNSYICSRCYDSKYYILDRQANKCIYIYNDDYYEKNRYYNNFNCYIENIGDESNPIYSCSKCYDEYNYLLVTAENNIKYCEYKGNEEIRYCTKANADTTYVNTLYNCTNCSFNFLPYFSKFYGKRICQNIYDKIINKKELSLDYEEEKSSNATNGTCKNNYFTPNGENCYSCNSKVGMQGCKGACNFSDKRNNVLKCEDGCDNGYIEVSEGVCESCNSVSEGCYECHYDNEYPADYSGIKRKRRFICDFCEEGYIKIDGKCLTCEKLGLNRCEKCEEDPKNKNEYICTQCDKWSILEDEGYCDWCDDEEDFISNNKCFWCGDYNNGGIKGCDECERNDNNQLICQKCDNEFILLTNNNTCLNISENKELEKFDKCEQLTLDNNNQLYCSRCKREYSLLNDERKCESLPILYDYNTYNYFRNYYYDYYRDFFYIYNIEKGDWEYIYDDEYYYYQNYYNYPCQEAVNLGTKDKPIYSCTKCYQRLIYNKAYQEANDFTKIINERNNVSFCVYQYIIKSLENCTEAINKTKDGVEKYDCLKCYDENKLVYDSNAKIHYCQYKNISTKCMVKYCKSCKNSNNYFCDECLLSNYEVNSISGACVEKSEVVPAVTFKDIFRLEMNKPTEINGQIYTGPSLMLRGITSSQINTRHAFLIYLTFKVKTSRNRNLEETEKRVPAICEAQNSVQKSENDVNIVDYLCAANATEDDNFENCELDNIDAGEEDNGGNGENQNLIKISNLKELVKNTNLTELKNKEFPSFDMNELQKIVIFDLDEVKNQTAEKYIFDFKIDGKLNKEITPITIPANLELNEIQEKPDCNLVIEGNKNANLNCKINIENYKDKRLLSFKSSSIMSEQNEFYVPKLNQISLINDAEEEEEEKKKNNVGLIVGCTVAGVVVLGGATALLIYFLKCRNSSINPTKNNNINNNLENYANQNNQGENNVIPFEQPDSKGKIA